MKYRALALLAAVALVSGCGGEPASPVSPDLAAPSLDKIQGDTIPTTYEPLNGPGDGTEPLPPPCDSLTGGSVGSGTRC